MIKFSKLFIYLYKLYIFWGLLWWLRWYIICLQRGRPGFDPWVGKSSSRKEWQPTPVFLPGEFHGQRSLVSYSPHIYIHIYTYTYIYIYTYTHIYIYTYTYIYCCCCCSVTKLCPTLCNPTDCSMPSSSVLQYLPEFAQTHVHWVSHAIQPPQPLLPPSFAFNLSQHQGLSNESALHIRWLNYQSRSFSISPSNR